MVLVVDYGKVLYSSVNKLKQNSNAPLIEEYIDFFVVGSSLLHLTFVAFCLLFVSLKQYPKLYNCYVN